MREFAKGVAQHIVGWMIVRALLDRLVKHYVANDDWDREKKDIAVKVAAEMESVKTGERSQFDGLAEEIAVLAYAALVGHGSFSLWCRNRAGAERCVSLSQFVNAHRAGFETAITRVRGQ